MSIEQSLPPLTTTSATTAAVPVLRPLPLRLNFAWTLAGNAVYGTAQWAMLVLLAKLGNAEMVGKFALGLALCAPVVMFTNMQLRIVQATDARNEYAFRDYLTLRLLTSAIAYLVIAGIALASHYQMEVVGVVLLVGAAKTSESISDVIFGLWQKNERMDLISISVMIKGTASLAAMWVLLHVTRNLLCATAGLFLVWASIMLTYDTAYARRLARRQPPPAAARPPALLVLRNLAWLALPLGVVGLLDSLNVNVPRYLIEHRLGQAALGHFAALAYVVVAGNMVVAALAHSAAPRLSREFVTDRAAFRRLVWRLVAFGSVIGGTGVVVAVWFGRPLLLLLYKPEYAAHANVFVWLMVAAACGYVGRFVVSAASAARAFRAQAPLYALSLAIVAGCSWWMVPRWGLLGAAWAVAVAAAALLAGAALILVYALRRAAGPETLQAEVRQVGASDGS